MKHLQITFALCPISIATDMAKKILLNKIYDEAEGSWEWHLLKGRWNDILLIIFLQYIAIESTQIYSIWHFLV